MRREGKSSVLEGLLYTWPMPIDGADGVNSWLFLEGGVDKFMNHLRDGIDLKTYMGLYTAIHNFCTAQKAVTQSNTLNASHRGGRS